MSTSENKLIIQRFVEEFWNARDLAVADEIFSPDCVTHQLRGRDDEPAAPRTPETVKNEASEWIKGFPDLRFSVVQTLAEGDRVVSQLQITGTHQGEWMGVAPTDRPIDVPLFVVHRIENQKIVEDWVLVGTLILFQQMGMVAPTTELFKNKESRE